MNKFVCLFLCGLVAVCAAAEGEGEEQFELVPYVANLCNQGCSRVCQLARTFCLAGGPVDCEEQKAQCDGVCASTCSCVQKCGPDCDTFESNCMANGLPPIAGVFCPVTGFVCDTACIVECPQQVFAGILQQMFSTELSRLQAFIQMIMATSAGAK